MRSRPSRTRDTPEDAALGTPHTPSSSLTVLRYASSAALPRRGRLAAAVSATVALAGCPTPAPPWGAGAAAMPGAQTVALAHLLDDASLTLATARLTDVTTTLRTEGLPLAAEAGAKVVFEDARLPLEALAIVRDPDGLALILEVAPRSIAWSSAAAGCPTARGALSLGPGRFTLPLAFATDDLGRLRPHVGPRARWDGLLGTPDRGDDAAASGHDCAPPDASALADALTRQLPPAVDLALAPELAPVLGLDLAAVLTTAGPPERPTLDLRLRARTADPVGPAEGLVAARFELQVSATPAPCVASLKLRDEPPRPAYASAPSGAGLELPVRALEAALEAVVLAGHLCGELPLSPPLDGPAVAALEGSWAAPLGEDPPAVSVAWSPTALPRLTATETPEEDGETTLTLRLDGLELALWTTWEGARWRLAAMTLDLQARLRLELGADGALRTRLEALEVEVPVARSGLLRPPALTEARALAAATLRPALDGLALFTLPASLAPATQRAVTVDPTTGLLTLPTR
jgi:hypothetical protein